MVVCSVVAMLLLAENTAALADVYKTGSKSCAFAETVWVRGEGTGRMRWFWPSGTVRYMSDHDIYQFAENIDTGKKSTTWKVSSEGGYLVDDGTYAYCVSLGAGQ